ncbi:hypothetical protein AMTRI_Chr03g44330 [Amborella trichopoda]|uniref:Uncharacterized protein n=1 Tax=Amborella trichopoda TaxID=13333 RepID=W1PU42_AMBTC|nr:late embryogenesis abundant protein 46 [Amborella trichopoda]ERN11583.1 hypothetical protein AMTR_s00022p00173750 [Amborella trichopoda]|eukprot:XP_006850002.1 late embryogenesis abundant protein 46 [Amborella trichopoda]
MQAGKNAVSSMKETAGNVAASAKAGMDKTKATMQEKVEKMSAHDPMQKQMAQQKKEARVNEAEINKQEAKAENAAQKEQVRAAGHGTGSALPGHGTGQPHDQLLDRTAGSHPIGHNTGTGGTTTRVPLSGPTGQTGYATGAHYG